MKKRLVCICVAILGLGSSPLLLPESASGREGQVSQTLTLTHDGDSGVAIQHPPHWSTLRRGDQILLWTTTSAASGASKAPPLKEPLGSSPTPALSEAASTIISILISSGVRESLQEFAAYVSEYERNHPIDTGRQPMLLRPEDVSGVNLDHVVSDGKVFVLLEPGRIATVSISLSAGPQVASLNVLQSQALEIVNSLTRIR